MAARAAGASDVIKDPGHLLVHQAKRDESVSSLHILSSNESCCENRRPDSAPHRSLTRRRQLMIDLVGRIAMESRAYCQVNDCWTSLVAVRKRPTLF
jgi:hypothetical protein